MSIFFSELDDYFLSKIPTLKVPNADGVMTPVPCSYHIPEGENVPSFSGSLITFHLYDLMLDMQRLESEVFILNPNGDGTTTVSKKPLPYRIYYQFDIWSEWSEDSLILLQSLQLLLPPRGSILVPQGDSHIDLFIELVDFRNADGRLWDDAQKRAEERFFRKILRYCVHTTLDIEQLQTYKQVKDVVIEIEQEKG